jgi:hypothetical protein
MCSYRYHRGQDFESAANAVIMALGAPVYVAACL